MCLQETLNDVLLLIWQEITYFKLSFDCFIVKLNLSYTSTKNLVNSIISFSSGLKTGLLSNSDLVKLNTLKKTLGLQPVDGYEPCADDYMTAFLNQASVKSALHVKADIEWVDCSRTIRLVLCELLLL